MPSINCKNRRGPRLESCGAPDLTLKGKYFLFLEATSSGSVVGTNMAAFRMTFKHLTIKKATTRILSIYLQIFGQLMKSITKRTTCAENHMLKSKHFESSKRVFGNDLAIISSDQNQQSLVIERSQLSSCIRN